MLIMLHLPKMGRLAEAGLNPNLMYGQGTVGVATQLPRYQAPTMQAPHFTVASDTQRFA